MFSLSLFDSKLIITYIALLFAYLISIALCGGIQAWVARAWGDDTAEQAGYLSFNPMDHIHLVGFIMFLLLGVGYGPIQPIDPSKLSPTYREIKLLCIYLTKPLINLLLAITSLVLLLSLLGDKQVPPIGMLRIMEFAGSFFQSGLIPAQSMFEAYPETHSVLLVFGIILLATLYANVIIAPFNLLIQLAQHVITLLIERDSVYVAYAQYILLFGPFIILLLFGNLLRAGFFIVTQIVGSLIAHIIGVV